MVDVILLLSLSLSRPSWTLHIFTIGINRACFWNIAQQVKSCLRRSTPWISPATSLPLAILHQSRSSPLLRCTSARQECCIRLRHWVGSKLHAIADDGPSQWWPACCWKDPFEILQSSCLHIHCNPYKNIKNRKVRTLEDTGETSSRIYTILETLLYFFWGARLLQYIFAVKSHVVQTSSTLNTPSHSVVRANVWNQSRPLPHWRLWSAVVVEIDTPNT